MVPPRPEPSMSPRLPSVPVLAAAVLALLALQGCGRRGPLESPVAAPAPAGAGTVVASPVGTARPKPADEPVRPNRPFVLDPLL
jgi:predicted small lipoprotein YifL